MMDRIKKCLFYLFKSILSNKYWLFIILTSSLFAQTGARYLIITHSNFNQAIQPLAQWKNKKGMQCKVAQLSETGSTYDSIHNYIVQAYNTWNPQPEYVLLVGSGNFVPGYYSSSSWLYTDNYFADVTGDYRAEIQVGRLPCNNLAQCSVMVSKTLYYEKQPTLNDSAWMMKGVTIVREDNDPIDDTIYWNNARFVCQLMSQASFLVIDSLSSQRGHNATTVINAVDSGRSFVLYRGQGVSNWWSPFAVNPSLTNNGTKLPVIASMTCQTMSMAPGESMIGERWLRVGTVAAPKGAVAFFGNTHTGSNIAAVRATATRGFFRNFFSSTNQLGKAVRAAKESLYVRYGNRAYYEGLNLNGDPELNILTAIPKPLAVNYPDSIGLGSQNIQIIVTISGIGIQNALVCLWKGAEVYVYGYTNAAGSVTLTVNPQTFGDMLITATARNALPFEGTITCIATLRDVGVTSIDAPSPVVDSGTSIAPACSVYNYGTTAETYRVKMKIGSFYNDSVTVFSHAPGIKLPVYFPLFASWPRGNFVVSCSTELSGDVNLANDRILDSVTVNVRDVGTIAITSLPSSVSIGTSVTPACTVDNFGTTVETYRVRMKIGSFYNDTVNVTNHLAGTKAYLSFLPITLNQIGTFVVSCSTELNSDAQPINNRVSDTVGVQTIGWAKKADVSGQHSGKMVKGGGSITVLGDNAYLLLGNNTRDFLRYSILSNTWNSCCSLPVGPKKKRAKKGAYLVNDENYIYAFKGGGTDEFYRYDTTTNTWNTLTSPVFTKGLKGGFAVYVKLDTDKYIYAGSGSRTNEWKRYNISTGAWLPAIPLTLPVEKAKAGSGIAYDGTGKIYFLLRGGKENDFYVTDITSTAPTWTAKKDLPFYPPGITKKKKVKEGGALAYFNNRIYAVKGGNTKEFWYYLPVNDEWVYVNEVGTGYSTPPIKGIKCGKSITANENGIYCLIGNNTSEFWYYGGAATVAKSTFPNVMNQTVISDFTDLIVQPNPAHGKISIYYSSAHHSPAKLTVYNTVGRIIYSAKTDKGLFTIDELPAGIYFIDFESKGYKENKKLVVLD